MKPSTLKDLKRSIAHWLRMATGKAKFGEVPTGNQCALCIRFLNNTDYDKACDGCPVRQRTGSVLCMRTPYRAAHKAFVEFGKHSAQFKEAAKKELKFLRSLLPKKKKKK